jgi:deazaflavin-dependent oxidoreductase (nitroreductase family)
MDKEDLLSVMSRRLIHLTTRGRKTGEFHTIELWFAVSNGNVYLSHEGDETDWMKNIKKNGAITFGRGGKNFTGEARYAKGHTGEAWTGKVALYEKYYGKASKEVIEDWFSLSKLVVIEARR